MDVAGKRSPLHGVLWRWGELACGSNSRRRLWGQVEVEVRYQEFLVGVQFGIAAQDQRAAIGGREVNVEHLDSGEFVEHGSRGEAAGQRLEPGAKRDVKAIGQEGDEDVGFDALFQLVIDRAQSQIILEALEGRLDFGQLDIELPQLGGLLPVQIGAQEIAAFAPSRLS